MKIYLVRHGQSRWQVKRDDSDWNSPLTALGQQQAQHLANWLAHGSAIDNGTRVEVQRIHASPLLRAQQTADPLTPQISYHIYTVTISSKKLLKTVSKSTQPEIQCYLKPNSPCYCYFYSYLP